MWSMEDGNLAMRMNVVGDVDFGLSQSPKMGGKLVDRERRVGVVENSNLHGCLELEICGDETGFTVVVL
jgi:hypothetical protein